MAEDNMRKVPTNKGSCYIHNAFFHWLRYYQGTKSSILEIYLE